MKLLLDIGQKTTKFALLHENRVLKAGLEDSEILLFPKSLEQVLPQLPLQRGEEFSASVLFSPMISKARKAMVRLTRKTPHERISPMEAKVLKSQAELKAQFQKEQELCQEYGILPKDFLFLGFLAQKHTVEGYPVLGLEGLKGKEVLFEGLACFCMRSYWEQLLLFFARKRVEKFVLLQEPQCVLSFAKGDGAYADVGEKITHLCLVREGVLQASEEIPFGSWEFTSALSADLGLSEQKAEELKRAYASNLVPEELRRRIRAIFLYQGEKLATMIQEQLSRYRFSFSHPVFLYGGGALVQEIGEAMKSATLRILLPANLWQGLPFSQVSNPQYTPLFLQLHGKV